MKTRLAEIISSRGLERRKIANDLGIERRTLDNYINETTLMNSDMIKKMSAYLQVSADYLLGIDSLSSDYLEERVDKIASELKEIFHHLNKK